MKNLRQEATECKGPAVAVLDVSQLEQLMRRVVREEVGEPAPAKRLLSVSALAEILDCGHSTVRRMMGLGLPHVRLGESPRFELDQVLAWLRSQPGATTPPRSNVLPLRRRGSR
ncbi:MAG: helix-turn-helix domain-containing protein [Deltaproteobacteria bacterium]|nr:helix-turn-helix domain-containing protein [Deltaproteobacteria bacterium]